VAGGRGRWNQKVEPSPRFDSTPISPSMSRQRRLQMASPRPDPPNLRVVDASAWVKLCARVTGEPSQVRSEKNSCERRSEP
jgi:hypothetical protein